MASAAAAGKSPLPPLTRRKAEEAERRYPWGKGKPRVSVLGRYRQSQQAHEGMHLSGHLDTVPAGRGWTKNPWTPVVEDGKLYGLGVSDMKGGIASIIGVLRAFNDLGLGIAGDSTFSFTPDEESGGMAGVGWLADQKLVKARYGIITEPSQPQLVETGHRLTSRSSNHLHIGFGRSIIRRGRADTKVGRSGVPLVSTDEAGELAH